VNMDAITGGCEELACPAGTCVSQMKMAGVTCRGTAGYCDLEEVCNGSTKECPEDTFMPTGIQCRSEQGVCDIVEFCTGEDAECPEDAKKPNTTKCRIIAGECDLPEYCNGTDNECPENSYVPTGTVCRPAYSGMSCDFVEYCRGDKHICPADGFMPIGTPCLVGITNDTSSQCNGISKKCEALPVNVTLTPQDTGVALPTDPPGQTNPTERGHYSKCGDQCFTCGAPDEFLEDLEVDGNGKLTLTNGDNTNAACHFEGCVNVVSLPYPQCLTDCIRATCPNSMERETAAFWSTDPSSGEWTCQSNAGAPVDELDSACPPWPHVTSEPLQISAVVGGDPRYSSRGGEMVQCDSPGTQVFAKNENYTLTVEHQPIPPHMATFVSHMRLTFAPKYGLQPLEFSASNVAGTWPRTDRSGPYMLVVPSANGEPKVQIDSKAFGFVMYVESVDVGGVLPMINFAFSGMRIASGIAVDGCPANGLGKLDAASVPESPACANVEPAMRDGCNLDVFATGTPQAAKASQSFVEMNAYVEYRPAQALYVKPATPADGGADGGASGGSLSKTMYIAIVATSTVCVTVLAIVFIVLLIRKRNADSKAVDEEVDPKGKAGKGKSGKSQKLRQKEKNIMGASDLRSMSGPESPVFVNSLRQVPGLNEVRQRRKNKSMADSASVALNSASNSKMKLSIDSIADATTESSY